ncbi:unnamed protein product [Musa textilis]
MRKHGEAAYVTSYLLPTSLLILPLVSPFSGSHGHMPRLRRLVQQDHDANNSSFPNSRLPNDYIALQAWKLAILSDPMNLTGNWVGPVVCNYTGIFCSPLPSDPSLTVVAGIDLNHGDLTGYLPHQLGLLANLTLLHINSNCFCGTLPLPSVASLSSTSPTSATTSSLAPSPMSSSASLPSATSIFASTSSRARCPQSYSTRTSMPSSLTTIALPSTSSTTSATPPSPRQQPLPWLPARQPRQHVEDAQRDYPHEQRPQLLLPPGDRSPQEPHRSRRQLQQACWATTEPTIYSPEVSRLRSVVCRASITLPIPTTSLPRSRSSASRSNCSTTATIALPIGRSNAQSTNVSRSCLIIPSTALLLPASPSCRSSLLHRSRHLLHLLHHRRRLLHSLRHRHLLHSRRLPLHPLHLRRCLHLLHHHRRTVSDLLHHRRQSTVHDLRHLPSTAIGLHRHLASSS